MALNLNTSPYFDDFDDAKKFARILFKPGVAVQARELTQLQTILQDSIKNFGEHIFKDGARVKGANGVILTRDFIKINDLDASSATVSNDTLINYVGDTVTGSTSGLKGIISKTATGIDSDAIEKKTLYIDYTQGNNSGAYLHFEAGETLTVTSTDSGRNGNTFVVDNGTDTSDPTRNYFGQGLDFKIEEGILFINGYFVYHDEQEITLEKYKLTANTYVGVRLVDSTITADADSTLNDPASGTFNFNAPGADRYKVTTTIAKLGLTESNTSSFVSLYTVENGLLARGDDVGDLDFYNQLGATLASRTSEESGNYVIRNFEISVREHLATADNRGLLTSGEGGSADHIAVGVGRGLAYVNGYRREFLSPSYIKVSKANESVVEEGFTVSTGYGNYVVVDEVAGKWNVAEGDLVFFGETASNAATDNTHSVHAAPSTITGQARVRQIRYQSGTINSPACQYRLYLYDIRMTAGEFKNIKTIYYNDIDANGFADPVLESGNCVLKETKNNTAVFRAPFAAAKTLATDTGSTYDNNYRYQKQFDIQFTTAGTATITVTGTETFPYGSTPTQTQLDTDFYCVLEADCTLDAVTYKAGEVFRLLDSHITSASSAAIDFDIGTSLSSATNATILVKVTQTDVPPTPKQVRSSRYVKIDTSTVENGSIGPWNLGLTDAYKIEAVYIDGSAYSESGNNYKDQFTLNSGQTDSIYGHSKLVKKPSATISTTSKYMVVKLSHFHPNYGGSVGSYFAIDSYPVDDTGASGVYTYEIPVYRSEKLGNFDLRDCIDFRPYVGSTAADSTTMAGATENPLETFELTAVSGGYEFPTPNDSYTTDAEYYLPRIDKVVLSEKGTLSVVSGASRLSPVPPIAPVTVMELATLYVPPYPSISPYLGRINNRKDYACSLKVKQNKRYTMGDIGNIEKRINRLEYYTSLNMLEKDTEQLKILDASGLDRFKNGIFINRFADHGSSNLRDPDFNAAVDTNRKLLTSNFFEENIDVVYDQINSTGITKTGNLLTLPYTSTINQRNRFASKSRNCIGALLFNFNGDMELFPPSDNFVNMEDGGDLLVPDSNIGQALENFSDNLNNAGIVNGVETTFTGIEPSVQPVAFAGSASDSDMGGIRNRIRTTVDVSFDASFNQTVEASSVAQSVDTLTIASTGSDTVTQNFGDRITDIGFSPFMRSQNVTFHATRLKPNTRFYAYFDGDAVSDNCRPLTYSTFTSAISAGVDNFWSDLNETTNAYGTPLVTDSEGRLAGQFLIPASRFRIGEKVLRLVDDSLNRDDFVTSSCTQTFSSFGLDAISQGTILSTQIPSFSFDTLVGDPQTLGNIVTDVRVGDITSNVGVDVNTTAWDPIAQTFLVTNQDGMFVPKIDLYFRTKSETLGVTIEIREVINGYPGARVVPYGRKYLSPSDVSISTEDVDGVVTFNATTITFDSPIYLEPGREYCIVILPQGNSPDYTHWVSELGKNQVGTTQRIVAEDVSSGQLFISSNNRTWQTFPSEDLMHTIYRCDFTITTPGIAKFNNGDIDYLKFTDFSSGLFSSGDNLHSFDITLSDGGTGHGDNDIITLAGFGNGSGLQIKVLSQTGGVIDGTLGVGFEINAMGSGYTADPAGVVAQSSSTGSGTGAEFTITVNTGVVERFSNLYNVARTKLTLDKFITSQTVSNGATTATVDTIENKTYNSLNLNFGEIVLSKTGIQHTYAGTKPSGVIVKGSNFVSIVKGEKQITTEEFAVYSKSNEVANLSSNKSFNTTSTLTSTTGWLSPVIDVSRCGYISTRNNINNVDTNEDSRNTGSALAKYISKRVKLADGQEAEDLNVFLDQNTPIGSSVKVYGKFLAPEDDAVFRDDLDWIELELVDTPADDGLSQTSFVEYQYKIPTANLDGNDVLTYQVKRVNSTTITAGGSGYTGVPIVTFSGGGAYRQAKGFAILSGNAVASIVITDPGRGYTSAPTITITGGGGSSATATATIGTVDYTQFKEFAVKIVMLTSNTSNVPKLKNLRAIALQA